MTLCTQWPWKPTKRCRRSYIIRSSWKGLTWRWDEGGYMRSKGLLLYTVCKHRRTNASSRNNTHTQINEGHTTYTPVHTSFNSLLLSVINLSVHIHAPHHPAPLPRSTVMTTDSTPATYFPCFHSYLAQGVNYEHLATFGPFAHELLFPGTPPHHG